MNGKDVQRALLHEYMQKGKTMDDLFLMICRVHPDLKCTPVSCRAYEYFVNVYAQNVRCIQNRVNLGEDYQAQCRQHQKKNFQIFRRQQDKFLLTFTGPPSQQVLMTAGTFRFFWWVADREVDVYMIEHEQAISAYRNRGSLRKPISSASKIVDDVPALAAQLSMINVDSTAKRSRGRPKLHHDDESKTRRKAVDKSQNSERRDHRNWSWHFPPVGTQKFSTTLH